MEQGQAETVLALLKEVFAANPIWREVLVRITRARPNLASIQWLGEILAQ